jgi:hypothetical protein
LERSGFNPNFWLNLTQNINTIEWLDASTLELNPLEKQQFEIVFFRAFHHIEGWNEDDLKMRFFCVFSDF